MFHLLISNAVSAKIRGWMLGPYGFPEQILSHVITASHNMKFLSYLPDNVAGATSQRLQQGNLHHRHDIQSSDQEALLLPLD